MEMDELAGNDFVGCRMVLLLSNARDVRASYFAKEGSEDAEGDGR